MNNNKEASMSANIFVSKVIRNFICIFLCLLSIIPFWIMIANATRSSVDIQSHFSLIPSTYLIENYGKLMVQANENVPLYRYMVNSFIIAGFSTIITVYFSALTAYGVTVYKFRGANVVWGFIMAIMMIPVQVSSIGFFRFMYGAGLGNNYIPLIIPAIAAPVTYFYMKQYMESTLPLSLIEAARIDGSGEFRTFNSIVLPLLKPAIAVQAIFTFVSNWNNYFTPALILHDNEKKTLPILIAQLRAADWLKFDMGQVYVMIAFSIFPVIVVYIILSKHIVQGVALGSVKG